MQKNFIPQERINIIINAFNELYNHMIKSQRLSAKNIKNFMEPYFINAGYRKSNIKGNENILIIHDAGIGDFILMSAVIREIRQIYPTAHITLLTNKIASSLAELCPYVDKVGVVAYPEEKNVLDFYKNMIEVVRNLLIRKIDIAFNFGQYPSTQLLAYMSGASEIVVRELYIDCYRTPPLNGFSWKFFPQFATFTADLTGLKTPHLNDLFICTLENYTDTKIDNRKLELWLSPADNCIAEINLHRFNQKKIYAIVMGSNSKLKCKRWSPKNYAQLINLISAEELAIFIILGGESEVEDGKIVKSLAAYNNVFDFTNKLTLRQSAAFLKLCDCYIGNDTGLMHAAAALKIPVLMPISFANDMEELLLSFPQRYYPYDTPSIMRQPKHALPECKNSDDMNKFFTGCVADEPHCINQITPEAMLQSLKTLQKKVIYNDRKPSLFY